MAEGIREKHDFQGWKDTREATDIAPRCRCEDHFTEEAAKTQRQCLLCERQH